MPANTFQRQVEAVPDLAITPTRSVDCHFHVNSFAGEYDVSANRTAESEERIHIILRNLLDNVGEPFRIFVSMPEGVSGQKEFTKVGFVMQVRFRHAISQGEVLSVRKCFAPQLPVIPAQCWTSAGVSEYISNDVSMWIIVGKRPEVMFLDCNSTALTRLSC